MNEVRVWTCPECGKEISGYDIKDDVFMHLDEHKVKMMKEVDYVDKRITEKGIKKYTEKVVKRIHELSSEIWEDRTIEEYYKVPLIESMIDLTISEILENCAPLEGRKEIIEKIQERQQREET